MDKQERVGALEKFGTTVDGVRGWGTKIWRLSVLMTKGAYLLGERRRLFTKLGEEVYALVHKGEIKNEQIQTLVHQLDRVTKKVEIEEMLVDNLRFGPANRRKPKVAEPEVK